jgi:hypothetical protein
LADGDREPHQGVEHHATQGQQRQLGRRCSRWSIGPDGLWTLFDPSVNRIGGRGKPDGWPGSGVECERHVRR